MRASWKLDRCRRAVERLSEPELRWEVFSGELIAQLRPAVGFDGWCAALADPDTGLPAVAVAEDSPVACCQRRFYQLEYQIPDISTEEAPAPCGRPVAVLSDVTGGDLARSRRWDELLRPAGTADELRAALEADGTRWGSLTLYRAAPGGWFPDDETRLVGSLHSAATRRNAAGEKPPNSSGGPPGVAGAGPIAVVGSRQMAVARSTSRSRSAPRRRKQAPAASKSSSRGPGARPSSSRPPASRSKVAACLAKPAWLVCRVAPSTPGRAVGGPIPIFTPSPPRYRRVPEKRGVQHAAGVKAALDRGEHAPGLYRKATQPAPTPGPAGRASSSQEIHRARVVDGVMEPDPSR
jgi:hypothetical protein